jgi:hypothetical protein
MVGHHIVASIAAWFCSQVDDCDIQETYAYRAGWLASEHLDNFNPYAPGTESFHHWECGHLAQQRYAMTIW